MMLVDTVNRSTSNIGMYFAAVQYLQVGLKLVLLGNVVYCKWLMCILTSAGTSSFCQRWNGY